MPIPEQAAALLRHGDAMHKGAARALVLLCGMATVLGGVVWLVMA